MGDIWYRYTFMGRKVEAIEVERETESRIYFDGRFQSKTSSDRIWGHVWTQDLDWLIEYISDGVRAEARNHQRKMDEFTAALESVANLKAERERRND